MIRLYPHFIAEVVGLVKKDGDLKTEVAYYRHTGRGMKDMYQGPSMMRFASFLNEELGILERENCGRMMDTVRINETREMIAQKYEEYLKANDFEIATKEGNPYNWSIAKKDV